MKSTLQSLTQLKLNKLIERDLLQQQIVNLDYEIEQLERQLLERSRVVNREALETLEG